MGSTLVHCDAGNGVDAVPTYPAAPPSGSSAVLIVHQCIQRRSTVGTDSVACMHSLAWGARVTLFLSCLLACCVPVLFLCKYGAWPASRCSNQYLRSVAVYCLWCEACGSHQWSALVGYNQSIRYGSQHRWFCMCSNSTDTCLIVHSPSQTPSQSGLVTQSSTNFLFGFRKHGKAYDGTQGRRPRVSAA